MINVRRLKYRAKYYGGLKRHFVLFWASILQTLFQTDWKSFLWKISTSVLAFHIFVVILPVCFISWIVLECYRRLMRRWISYKEKGDIEVADVTFRTAMSTNDHDPILTILFSLEGHVENHVIEIWLKDLLAKRNDSGDLVHKHFKSNLVKVNGFYCWKIDQNFDLQNHIIRAPSHHHGTILTERNIQEYISEVCSEMLSKNQSPWQVKLIEGFAENGTRVTWIVFRLHHLLSSQINLPDFSLSLPNPWDTVNTTRVYNILEAPNATKKLLTHVKYYIFNSVGYFFKKLKVLLVLIREYLKNFHLNTLKGCNRKWILEPKYFSRFSLSDFKLIVQALKPEKSLINLILKNASTFTDICLRSIVYVYMRSKYILLTLINFNFEERCKIFRNNSTFCMVQNAIIELFWMLRALLSLPRLILEEIYESKDTSPINTCKRKNFQKWKRLIVSWSEDTPMDGAKGIQGVSGTSVSCVLLTALAGGIRDLLRYSGAQAPEYVRCTLPVCIPHMFPLKGLLPLSLPTGCSYGRKALREVSKSLEKMKNYPESYLASSWLIKNLCKFLPERLLCFILKHLSKSYPVLLINIVGSSQTSYIWGLKLKSAFYWRPPQNDASISVCISSYCGNISVGVMADGWSVPHVSYLPKSFLSHLNELAVESGVGIKRKNSKPLCKTYSPVEPPSPVGSSSASSMKSWNKVLFHFKNNAVFRQKFVSIEKLTSQEKSNSN